jgi:5'-nucleotidase
MAVGNHEFDDGPEVLRTFIEAVPFPVLMANADVSAEPALADLDLATAVIEAGGARIGLIGLTPTTNPELSSPGPNITFTDPVTATQDAVDALTGRGIERIVLLSHSGLGIDRRIAEETRGVDVIVGGHSHTFLSNTDPDAAGPYPLMVGETAIVQAYAYGKYLGALTVTFDAGGRVTAAEGAPILLDASVAEDADMAAWVAEMAEPLDEIRARVVGETASLIDGDRANCRARECTMGNLVADAMLDRVRDQGIEVAIQNGGGLRASIEAGDVTMGDVLTVLPFQNTLSTFRVNGATLKAALENGVSGLEDGGGRFPQVAGLTFRFDPGAAPGSRIVDVKVDTGEGFVPLEPGRMYGVVSNNFVRKGGDGYGMFAEAQDAYDFGPDLADVTAEYLGRNAPYRPYLDGRIDVLE